MVNVDEIGLTSVNVGGGNRVEMIDNHGSTAVKVDWDFLSYNIKE